MIPQRKALLTCGETLRAPAPGRRFVSFRVLWSNPPVHEPPGRLFHAGAALVALGVAWAASLPEIAFGTAAALGLGVAVVGIVWFVRFACAVLRPGRRPARAWLVVPGGGLLLAALVLAGAPLQARFALARGDLTAVAQSLGAAGGRADPGGPAGGRIGTYKIDRVEVRSRVVFFSVGDDPLIRARDGGFAYVPDGVDVPAGTPYVANLRPLGGNWYRWYVDRSD